MERRGFIGRDVSEARPGWFRMSLVRGGWKVPCQIERNESGEWRATIDGEEGQWSADWVDAGVDRIWLGATEIPHHEYLYQQALKEHLRASDPDHPCLHPRKRMDHNLLKPIAIR